MPRAFEQNTNSSQIRAKKSTGTKRKTNFDSICAPLPKTIIAFLLNYSMAATFGRNLAGVLGIFNFYISVLPSNDDASKQVEETEQTSEPGPEQEMESCEQEIDSAEPVPEPALETSASEPETPTPPLEPAIVVCSQLALQNGQPSCTNVSLYALLEYRRQREKLSFEVGFMSLGWTFLRDVRSWPPLLARLLLLRYIIRTLGSGSAQRRELPSIYDEERREYS